MNDDRKPKRRSALRHALGGLALLVLMVTNVVLLDQIGVIDSGSWRRQIQAQFGGQENTRNWVSPGMTRREVEGRIGEGSEVVTWISMSAYPGQPYPTPYCHMPYREYGFKVVYHCHEISDSDNWTVLAVEDWN